MIHYGTAGGSISKLEYGADYMVSKVPTLRRAHKKGQLHAYNIIPPIDSTDMIYGDREYISCVVARARKEGATGLLISQGTDQLEATSARLSLEWPDVDIPVVITGSEKSIDEKGTDAKAHLAGAYIAASDPRFPGVYVFYEGRLMLGARVRKNERGTFRSWPYPDIAHLKRDTLTYTPEGADAHARHKQDMEKRRKKAGGALHLIYPEDAALKTTLFALYQDYPVQDLDKYDDKDAIILRTLGKSGIPHRLLKKIGNWVDRGKLVCAMSYTPGLEVDFTDYPVGTDALEAGVVPLFDMTGVFALEKSRLALSLTKKAEERRRFMLYNLADEIRPIRDDEWKKLNRYNKQLGTQDFEPMLIKASRNGCSETYSRRENSLTRS